MLAVSAVAILAGCARQTTNAPQVDYQLVRMDSAHTPDAIFDSIISLYHDSLCASLNKVIGVSDTACDVERPETPFTSFVANALLCKSREYAAAQHLPLPEVAIHNIGGIRAGIGAGVITIKEIYEISPFDNVLSIVQMRGADLLGLLRHAADRGGEALAGATMVITPDSNFVEARVGGLAIDTARIYTVASIDYLVNGGDAFDFSANTFCHHSRLYTRDLLMSYIIDNYTSKGLHVTLPTDVRVAIEQKCSNK